MTSRTFRTLVSFTALTASLSLLSTAALQAQVRSTLVPNRLTQPIDNNARVTLKGTVHPLANALNDRGAASASMPLDRIQIVLKRSPAQEASLKQLIEEQNRPGSANYHKWLTPEQFGQKFGPSDQDVAALEAWLESQGFNIEKLNPGRQTLVVSGSALQFQNAFHAQIHKYEVSGQIHYANATNPQIPAALAPVFGGFASLNDFRIKPRAVIRGKAAYNPKTQEATPQWTVGSTNGVSFVLSPADFATEYDLTSLYNAGTNGVGQTIAIINEANINVAVVNAFRTTFGLPFNPPRVVIDGNDPGVDGVNNPDGQNGASVEAYVDVEWAGAVAPAATVDLVIASDTALESGLILAAEHAVYSNIAPIMSLSFGFCEAGLTSENAFIDSLWEQAAAQGITVVVASGDSGSAGCDLAAEQYATKGAAVSGFASTPYNVAVGGTDFYYSSWNQGSSAINNQITNDWNTTSSNGSATASIKGYIPEQPWNDSQFGLNLLSYYTSLGVTTVAGGGGGASSCGVPTLDSGGNLVSCAPYPKPYWQTGLGVPADKARDIPDVSLFAADGVNASYYPSCTDDGDCQGAGSSGVIQISGGGGTSFAAPAFAGIMALVNQKYGRQGQADSVLYPLARQFPAVFHDVTNGTNSVPCLYSSNSTANSTDCIAVSNPISISGSFGSVTEGQIGKSGAPAYEAGSGYDLASGLGSVDAGLLVNHWGDVTFTGSTTTLTPSQVSFQHGAAINISGTVTGTSPTGTVALMTDSNEQGQQAQGIGQFLSGAPSVFTVTDGTFSASNITTLPGGTYSIWGQYSGDGTNAPSTSDKTLLTVTPEASGIFLNVLTPSGVSAAGVAYSTIPSSIAYGTQLQFNALVAPGSKLSAEETCLTSTTAASCPVYGPPTGTVTFYDNGQAFNTAMLNAEGDAEYDSADLVEVNPVTSVGAHSVIASYAGDSSYSASTAATITYTVTKATPTLTAKVMPTVPASGQSTNITVIVQSLGVGAAPTGSIAVSGGPSGTPSSVTLVAGANTSTQNIALSNSAGIGILTIPASAAAGKYNLTLTYSGDSNYTTGQPLAQTITLAAKSTLKPSTTTITTSASATSPASPVAFTITVAGDGVTVPTGSVDVQLSGNDIGSFALTSVAGTENAAVTLSGNSRAYFLGANLISAVYSGDKNYAGSSATAAIANPRSDFTLTPATMLIPVTPGTPAMDVIQLASVNGFSGTVNLTCAAGSGIGCTMASGATLTSGGTTSVTLTLNAGSAAENGMHDVVITASDSTNQYVHTLGLRADLTGATTPAPEFYISAPQVTTISPGALAGNTIGVGVIPLDGFRGKVTFTASILGVLSSPSAGNSPPTFTFSPSIVDLSGGNTLISTMTIATTSSTTLNTYQVEITAKEESGSLTQDAIVNVTVSQASFALSANPANLTLKAGANTGNSAAISVTPSGGFTGVVNFTCAVTTAPVSANDPPTCSAPAATITGGAATSTLTVTTTATTTSAAHDPLSRFFAAGGGIVVAGLLFFGIPARRRKWRSILMVLVFAGITGFGIGCGSGGGNSGGGSGGTTIPGTTAGSYVLTVTAKDAATGQISATTTVNLTVN